MPSLVGSEMCIRDRLSDHRIAFIQSGVAKVMAYKMMNYTYRYYNTESEVEYGGGWRVMIGALYWIRLVATPKPRCTRRQLLEPWSHCFHWSRSGESQRTPHGITGRSESVSPRRGASTGGKAALQSGEESVSCWRSWWKEEDRGMGAAKKTLYWLRMENVPSSRM